MSKRIGPKRLRRVLAVPLATVGTFFLAVAVVSADDWGWKEARRNMVQIVGGKVDDAIRDLDARLAAQPAHGETLFALAIASALKNEMGRANGFVERALRAGVPPERFFAGPRDLVAPLAQLDSLEAYATDRGKRLIHGPLLGAVTSTSARFWARTRHETVLQVIVREDGGEGEPLAIASPVATTRADTDYTAVVEVCGLAPDTSYLYRLVVDGEGEPTSHRFRTFPAEGRPARFDVAFGGGAAFFPDYERIFSTIAMRRPLAFFQLGDNVYIDQPRLIPVQRYCYYRRQSSSPYRALVGTTPVFAIWDDHDFGDDDCWGGPEIDQPPWKSGVWKVFRQNWNNPDYAGGAEHPGCYFETRIADVHFIFLDCRYYRDAPKGGKKRRGVVPPPAGGRPRSMLGPVQKAWLLDTLRRSTGTFKVIASSVPFASGVKPKSKDPWDGFPEEREEIFSFLARQKIEGVVLIAADRHRSDLWRIERPGAYDLWEFQSSRLTNIHTHPVLKGSVWGFNKDRSFGLLSFDTVGADPTVTYRVVTVDNRVVREFTLARSSLRVSGKN